MVIKKDDKTDRNFEKLSLATYHVCLQKKIGPWHGCYAYGKAVGDMQNASEAVRRPGFSISIRIVLLITYLILNDNFL